MITKITHYLAIISLLFVVSCIDDESVYNIQEKEDVEIDNSYIDEAIFNADKNLKPGLITDTITFVKLLENDTIEGQIDTIEQKRVFKYYFPLSLQPSKPVSLVFKFHGGADEDPMLSVSKMSPFNAVADTANIIVVYPKGLWNGVEFNWVAKDDNLAFFDALVQYFTSKEPMADFNRIYSCGHSSGGIFSYTLAMERSDVIAAITPVAGQYRIVDFIKPERAVPIRAFNGIEDNRVNHSGAKLNFTNWAVKVGDYWWDGYQESQEIINEYDVDVFAYNNAATDLEFYSIVGAGHYINWHEIRGSMWNFMQSHPLDMPQRRYFMLREDSAAMAYGYSTSIDYKVNEGANMIIDDVPEGWVVAIEDNQINITAPDKNSGANLKGNMKVRATTDGVTDTKIISVEATDGYTFGEIIIEEADTLGVVFWVNSSNPAEAKMVALTECDTLQWGIYNDYVGVIDADNGKANTESIVEYYTRPGSEEYAAHQCYAYKDYSGWYLPAENELAELFKASYITILNAIMVNIGAEELDGMYYWSSTEEGVGTAVAYNAITEAIIRMDVEKANMMTARPIKHLIKTIEN